MLLLLHHKPSKQSEHSGLRPDTSSLVNNYDLFVGVKPAVKVINFFYLTLVIW